MSDQIWPVVRVDGDLDCARLEWVHANGAGAYASSTIARMHTRRYHGLLIAALDPPRKRHVVLSHVDATVRANGVVTPLATHQFPGVPPTGGYRLLAQFGQDPLPRWVYRVAGGELTHSLCLARGANAAVLRYDWNGPGGISLELRPLMAMRSFHGLVHEHGAMVQRVEMRQYEVAVRPVHNLPRVVFRHRGIFVGSPDWWRRFEYLQEQKRGLDFQEDLWTPGVFRVEVPSGTSAYLLCSVDQVPEGSPEELFQETTQALMACDPGPGRVWSVRSLSVAAEAFRADLAPIPGVVAGYPWFELWGRHTLIAFAGLYIIPGKLEPAKQVLLSLIQHIRQGLVPNRLPDEGGPAEYHAVDATLLIFDAARRLSQALGSTDPFVTSTILPALEGIFAALREGTRDGIQVTPEGLLAAGSHGTSLTWMDARVDGRPVTSRNGLAVEIQALWTRACDTLGWLAAEAGDEALAIVAREARDRARKSFQNRFWCDHTNYPYDVISPKATGVGSWFDATIRPNALIALATDPDLFTHQQAQSIIAVAERELVTSAGIRTLSPRDTQYRATYEGSVADRDGAYHQGTAWPSLVGAYVRAVRNTYPEDTARAAGMRSLIEGMLSNVSAVGQVPEIVDGEPPHRPNGCPAQSTSVAELLRALVEDLGL